MKLRVLLALPLLAACALAAQMPQPSPAFEVATIKPVESTPRSPRYIVMEGPHRFVEKDYTLKLLIAAAYNLNPKAVSGGPPWIESDHYDILALTPGQVQPSHDQQMAMLRTLLAERFKLSWHHEPKVFSIYALEIAKGGSKLKPSTAPATDQPALISTVYPQRILMPARNASMADFVSVLQRAVLDRPVVDKTGLTGRYDFNLEWAPDESQFGDDVGAAPSDTPVPPFFTAIQQQLGLRLEATRGPIQTVVVDHAERPSAN
ncbi:MAG: TIGR03435 family protein [Terracidiphilus sp.]